VYHWWLEPIQFKESGGKIMAKYIVESPHTPEECLKAMDEVLAMGPDVLKQYYFGCMSGEHTGWVILDAKNESEALEVVPNFLRSKARAVAVNKFTPEQIMEEHRK
jgi:hypothetical protein